MRENGDRQAKQKKARARGWHRLGRHRAEPSGSVEELAAQLAPLEEQTAARGAREAEAGAKNHNGAIVVDTGTLKLPEGLVADGAKPKGLFGIEPVVLVLVALALAFILFIAWQISQTPPTPN